MVQIKLPAPDGRQAPDRDPGQPCANTAAARIVQVVALWLALLAAPAARPQSASLEGYLFREADGAPPRVPLNVELQQETKIKYRTATRPDGAFSFEKLIPGHYMIVARLPAGVFSNDAVEIVAGERNFAAVMLPKRHAGPASFNTVSAETLARRSNQRLQNQIRRANRILESGDFAAAAREYEKIAGTDPDAGLYDGLALVYLQLGRPEQAYQAFEQALARDPKFLFAYSHLGAAYADEGKHAELATVAARALAVDPRWAGAHLLMGEAYVRSGRLEEATRHALTAEELTRGKSPDPHLLLARILWSQKDCPAARERLDRYLGLRTTARRVPALQPLMRAVQDCVPAPAAPSAW